MIIFFKMLRDWVSVRDYYRDQGGKHRNLNPEGAVKSPGLEKSMTMLSVIQFDQYHDELRNNSENIYLVK